MEPDTIGVTKAGSGWLYLHGGIFDANADTIAANEAGWWKIRNGLVDFSYTGLAYNETGWYYLQNGLVDFGYCGAVQNEFGTTPVISVSKPPAFIQKIPFSFCARPV